MGNSAISKKVLRRLPGYLDSLKLLPEDVEIISATTIAKKLEFANQRDSRETLSFLSVDTA